MNKWGGGEELEVQVALQRRKNKLKRLRAESVCCRAREGDSFGNQ